MSRATKPKQHLKDAKLLAKLAKLKHHDEAIEVYSNLTTFDFWMFANRRWTPFEEWFSGRNAPITPTERDSEHIIAFLLASILAAENNL